MSDTTEQQAAKHTPGPWTVADYRTIGSGNYVVRSPEKGPDDEFPVVASVVKRPGAKANAQLIIAAPDLLEAAHGVDLLYAELQSGLRDIVNKPAFDLVMEAVRKARAAIAKAEAVRP